MPLAVTTDCAKHGLLERLIDDASLFPPARLPMRLALNANARHRESAYWWIGGNFVVPASRLAELVEHRAPSQSVTLNVILDAAMTAKGDTIRADLDRVTRASAPGVTIAAFELKVPGGLDEDGLRRAVTTIAEECATQQLAFWYEIAYDGGWGGTLDDALAALVAVREQAPAGLTIGAKLRCGGLAPGATPSVDDVAAFILAAQAHDVPWKATAGLHHPVRGVHGGETMHGFLNVFIAGIALRAGVLEPARVADVVAEDDPRAFLVDPMHVGWRDVGVDAEGVAAAREHCVAFGSCSFDDPVNGLRELGLLL